ncbi:competence protein [Hanstruepera neustonica]|uniref:Competence protein n=1 Tax=Hanstruepera neustonica TaxID=1445657 RepID=A0A2K1E4P1_9FLAO|nr:ComEC/Rec2 family competence protein [Hanstruepera neustonica]PNQ75233.1 competence protein [Hanstruepera neustonica]
MKLLDFPIVKLTLCLIVGIIIGSKTSFTFSETMVTSCVLLLATLVNYIISKNKFKKTVWFGLFALLTTISIGILIVNFHNQQNQKKHYNHFYDYENPNDSQIILSIREQLKPTTYHDRYIANIIQIDSGLVHGKVQLNISKDLTNSKLPVDHQILISSKLQALKPPLNPFQFNYKAYLENKNIHAQINSDHNSLTVLKTTNPSVLGFANTIRQSIITKLENYNFRPEELAVIKALLLGYRQDISKNLYEDYANAGAIHILAISGLHIGIILIMLNYLFGFLRRFKYGLAFKTTFILILLWSFALIAGLSPSILRATTMFSVFAFGMNLKRPHNTMNTLAISAFLLLLINPFFLFEVGFQLSYLAVIGIVIIYPMLKPLLRFNYKVPNKIWELLAVSFAAQIGILPLSLFYFHQFPSLFFISNVLIIPILGFILGFGFFIILLAVLNTPQNILFDIYGFIIHAMNSLFKWVAHQEAFLFKDIPMNWFLAIGLYVMILTIINYFKSKHYKNLSAVLISILIFQILLTYNKWQVESHDEMVVFHKSRFSLVGIKNGNHLNICHNLDSTILKNNPIIANYEVGNFIQKTEYDTLKNVYQFKNKKLLIIDSLGIYQNLRFNPDYILLRNSPKINLTRLIDSLNPICIIADGSNYKSYINRWEQTCKKRKLPFHYTGEKGAYIVK